MPGAKGGAEGEGTSSGKFALRHCVWWSALAGIPNCVKKRGTTRVNATPSKTPSRTCHSSPQHAPPHVKTNMIGPMTRTCMSFQRNKIGLTILDGWVSISILNSRGIWLCVNICVCFVLTIFRNELYQLQKSRSASWRPLRVYVNAHFFCCRSPHSAHHAYGRSLGCEPRVEQSGRQQEIVVAVGPCVEGLRDACVGARHHKCMALNTQATSLFKTIDGRRMIA